MVLVPWLRGDGLVMKVMCGDVVDGNW